MTPRLRRITACREPLSSRRVKGVMASPPQHGAAHQGAPRVHRLSPALSHLPSKLCGKHWLLLLNKLYRGLLHFNQSLVICGVLSCCSDPVPRLDLRAGAQASSPAPESLSRFLFPSRNRRCCFSLHRGKARDLPALANPALLKTLSPSSLPSLPPTPAQGKIDQCIFIDGLNTQKKGKRKKKDVAIETSIKLPSPRCERCACVPRTGGLWWVGVEMDRRCVWGCLGLGAAWAQPPRVPPGLLVAAVVPAVQDDYRSKDAGEGKCPSSPSPSQPALSSYEGQTLVSSVSLQIRSSSLSAPVGL